MGSVVSNQISPCMGGTGPVSNGAVVSWVTIFPVICFVPLASILVTRCAKADVAKRRLITTHIKDNLSVFKLI